MEGTEINKLIHVKKFKLYMFIFFSLFIKCPPGAPPTTLQNLYSCEKNLKGLLGVFSSDLPCNGTHLNPLTDL